MENLIAWQIVINFKKSHDEAWDKYIELTKLDIRNAEKEEAAFLKILSIQEWFFLFYKENKQYDACKHLKDEIYEPLARSNQKQKEHIALILKNHVTTDLTWAGLKPYYAELGIIF